MNKITRNISFVLLAIIFLNFTGCGMSSDRVSTETSNLQSNSKVDLINYNPYLKKIWIEENWDGGDSLYPIHFSFYITDIEEAKIEGKFSMDAVADSDYLLGDFTGTIKNGTADCQFEDDFGNKGNMKLGFIENNKLEVSIEYTGKDSTYEIKNGDYLFRPYNLKDFEVCLDSLKTRSFVIDLSWGKANLVIVQFKGNKPYQSAYLMNDDNDILYHIDSFQVAFEVKDVLIEDQNRDGLEDVEFITYAPEDPDVGNFEWVYFQMENGRFYLNEDKDLSN